MKTLVITNKTNIKIYYDEIGNRINPNENLEVILDDKKHLILSRIGVIEFQYNIGDSVTLNEDNFVYCGDIIAVSYIQGSNEYRYLDIYIKRKEDENNDLDNN